MAEDRDKLTLQREIELYRELLRQFPDGAAAATIRDLIEELEQEATNKS
jgi:phosphatidate phosphatase APP1